MHAAKDMLGQISKTRNWNRFVVGVVHCYSKMKRATLAATKTETKNSEACRLRDSHLVNNRHPDL